MKLTADTITDAQLRELRASLVVERPPFVATSGQRTRERIVLCQLALGVIGTNLIVRAAARARCAEILNARGAK